MRVNAYGRIVEIIRTDNSWRVFYIGGEGKKRLAEDIIIPPEIEESNLIAYLEDLLHEWASGKYPHILTVN